MSTPTYDGPIVDAHFHNFAANSGGLPDFKMKEYDELVKDVNIVAAVHLQVTNTLDETKRLREQYEQNSRSMPNAIIFGAELDKGPEVAEKQILGHKEISSRVRGIRQSLSYIEKVAPFADKENLAGDPTFRKAFALLDRHDLSFDAWCFSHQLNQVADLANAFPRIPIMLNHFGTPVGIEAQSPQDFWVGGKAISREKQDLVFQTWKEDFMALAASPNVHIKLSGLFMTFCLAAIPVLEKKENVQQLIATSMQAVHKNKEIYDVQELVAAILPYVAHAISCFGVDRCVWASNYPPDGFAGISYANNWNAYALCLDQLNISQADQTKIFYENAQEFYRFEPAAQSKL